jgi:hypothetical protein
MLSTNISSARNYNLSPLEGEKLESNYPNNSGSHSALSPVVASRKEELAAVKNCAFYSTLCALESRICEPEQFSYLIPLDKKDEADKWAKQLFLDYISKYANHGVTEKNIVKWSEVGFNKTFIHEENAWNTWHVAVLIMQLGDKRNEKFGHYLPPHITAYHEVMHVEETPKGAPVSFEQEKGNELLTTIKTFILLDTVYKQIHGLNEDDQVDYKQTINFPKKALPLGEFINFYRQLENEKGSLHLALISEESFAYLNTLLPPAIPHAHPKEGVVSQAAISIYEKFIMEGAADSIKTGRENMKIGGWDGKIEVKDLVKTGGVKIGVKSASENNTLEQKLNFLNSRGTHTASSPVVGSRAHELLAIKNCAVSSTLYELEVAVGKKEFTYLIPVEKADKADAYAQDLFLGYISKYAHEGVTKENIVKWTGAAG